MVLQSAMNFETCGSGKERFAPCEKFSSRSSFLMTVKFCLISKAAIQLWVLLDLKIIDTNLIESFDTNLAQSMNFALIFFIVFHHWLTGFHCFAPVFIELGCLMCASLSYCFSGYGFSVVSW